jgi:hypothetical protein
MHHEQPRFRVGLRAGAMLAHVALIAACGHRSVQVSAEWCEDEPPPACFCAQHAQAPVCAGDTWGCPPCIVVEPKDAGLPEPHPDATAGADAMLSPDVGGGGTTDARDGASDGHAACDDGASLVCRRGCDDRLREWPPLCDSTGWLCRWGGSLEQRSTPPRPCSDGG